MNKREEGKTLVLERETEKLKKAKSILFPDREKKEEKAIEETQTAELKEVVQAKTRLQLDSVDRYVMAEKELKNQQAERFVQEPEAEEIAKEEEFFVSEEQEPEQEEEKEQIAKIETLPAPKKSPILRLKIVVGIYVAVVLGLCGWAVYNAVDLSNLSSEFASVHENYLEKTAKFVSNTNKLNSLIQEDKLTSIAGLEQAEIIKLAPKPLEKPTEHASKSNWFDRICNFISRIFGG